MKRLFTIMVAALLTASVFAQSPQKMSYQAVIQDADKELVITQVGMRISILQGSETGTPYYVETQTPTPNANGLVSIEIGTGTSIDDFSAINWSNGPYYIKTETDPDNSDGLTDYTIIGTSQLLSVPYALYAAKVANLSGTNTGDETDATIKTKLGITTLSGSNTGDQDLSDKVDKVTGKDLAPNGTTPGQMLYWDGSAWVDVPAGSNGQVLTSVYGVPVWTNLVGATTDGPKDVINPITGKIWMDRNLGAIQSATSSNDPNAFGGLYQWGRGSDGHEARNSGTTTTLSSGDTPGHGNFILPLDYPNDWRNPQNADLWQGVNSVNNPCPSGYRIPTQSEWEQERLYWSSNDAAGGFASPLKLTVAGFRDYTDNSLSYVGTSGYYWSSSIYISDSSYSINFLTGATGTGFGSGGRAYGCSVRCIKD